MMVAVLGVAVVTLLLVVVLLLRKPQGAAAVEDPRLSALLAADVPGRLAELGGRFAATEQLLRDELARLRTEGSAEALRSREALERSFAQLRGEVGENIASFSKALHENLHAFRTESGAGDERLRVAVEAQIKGMNDALAVFTRETAQRHVEDRDALYAQLKSLGREQGEQQERLRGVVEERLAKLNTDNTAKLEEMRATVDEKLQRTLNERLTHSFGQVTTHLGEVQKGLGEMKELASGVGDLKKVLTGVKTRGIVGEFLLGQQLEQMFSPEQYVRNARIKPDTTESVEYALKFPNGPESHVLLAIDSKFPREVGERLMAAYDAGNTEDAEAAGKEFERAIRFEGKKICDKYIDPPTTLPHAIMFLPTEFLYAEVVRRPGLQSELQQNCRVTIAGPSTFMAILTSFQMGFHTIAIEKKGNEVWKVLAGAKKEFETFGGLMESMEKQVGTVQNTIQKLGTRSRAITRTLREVGSMETSGTGSLMSADTVLPLLAASEDDQA